VQTYVVTEKLQQSEHDDIDFNFIILPLPMKYIGTRDGIDTAKGFRRK